jgi:hypothetical protein
VAETTVLCGGKWVVIMRQSKFLLSVAAAALISGVTATAASAAFPGIGADTNGPALILTVQPGGSFTVANGPGFAQGPYDGSDDAYIGVVNNSGVTINSVTLHGTVNTNGGIFGFDGDGIGNFPGVGTNASDTSNGHYGGPNSFFSGITCSAGICNDGTVNFVGGMPAGSTGVFIFSLENPLTAGQIIPGTVPLPATWAMMLAGFAGIGYLAYRGTKKNPTAVAAT